MKSNSENNFIEEKFQKTMQELKREYNVKIQKAKEEKQKEYEKLKSDFLKSFSSKYNSDENFKNSINKLFSNFGLSELIEIIKILKSQK